MIVTVKEVLDGAKSDAILGVANRAIALDLLKRAIEIAAYRCNWNVWVSTLDTCSDGCGCITLPTFVGTVLQVNVGGGPTIFRTAGFEFHVNGPGSSGYGGPGYGSWYSWLGNGGDWGPGGGFSDDMEWSPVYQQPNEWSVVAAICEDQVDGNGTLSMIVEGETQDRDFNTKNALTIPATGPSSSGVQIPLIYGTANIDTARTLFRKITRVTKPVTRGYVKLLSFPVRQLALSMNTGYYAPNETNPTYRRIKVGARCAWTRIRYRRASLALVNDWDVVPIGSYQATLDLLKSIRLSDSNNVDLSEQYLAKAVRLLSEIQSVESGFTWSPLAFEPGLTPGTLDWR